MWLNQSEIQPSSAASGNAGLKQWDSSNHWTGNVLHIKLSTYRPHHSEYKVIMQVINDPFFDFPLIHKPGYNQINLA